MSAKPATIGGDFNEGLGTVRQNGRLYHTPSFSDDGISFRLVHDDEKQTILGSSIVYNSHVARTSDGAGVTASHIARSIGYRLCVDWREQ